MVDGDVRGIRVTVLVGGAGSEAEVSRSSGAGVAAALKRSGFVVDVRELDRAVLVLLASDRPDVVFPALHGGLGEDGSVQGMLNCLGLPYVGSGVAACACAMDKTRAKSLFQSRGLGVAPGVEVRGGDDVAAACARILDELGTDVVVKPAGEGSSIGVEFPSSKAQLAASLDRVGRFGDVLVEKRIRGREVTVGVLDLGGPVALPAIEITTPEGAWYDYEHRYTAGLSGHVIPAGITPEQAATVCEAAVTAHVVLGCRQLSRADFIVPAHDEPTLLEVNTMPGMTPTSLFPDAAEAAGHGFDALMRALVLDALTPR